jgi:hypothetical protein
MSIDKVSKKVIHVGISASIQSFALEEKQRAQSLPTATLNGFAYHFYDGEARRSMARRVCRVESRKTS